MISGERSWRRKEEFGENFYLIKINHKSTKVSHIIVMKVCKIIQYNNNKKRYSLRCKHN